LFFALVSVMALAAISAAATTVVSITADEQVASARAICIGRCTRIESRKINGTIYTYITLDVREVIKGRVTLGDLVIKQTGGEVGDDGQWIYGSPRFDVGRDALVFLGSNGDGAYVVDGLFMGNFSLETDSAGRQWAMRDDGGEGSLVLDKSGHRAEPLRQRIEVNEIRALATQQASKAPLTVDDDVLQIPAEYGRPFEGESETWPSYVLFNTCRWFEPDSAAVVTWYSNSTNFDSDESLGAALTDALAAWSTIDGCTLRMVNGGEDTTGCGWAPLDHVSRVSIDCRNEIASQGCRSIIAIGGAHYTTRETVVVNGTTFRRILEGDVVLNDGYCDLFQNPLPLREIITHELGHNIGLGHSADSTATMAPFVHNDGRGAMVKPDDIAGAQFIYPGSSGGGGGGGGETDPDPPSIATTSLPQGTVGVGYQATLAVTNGKAPFEWTLTSGTLPVGVALSSSGVLAGAPTIPGSFSFSVRVTDSLGRVDGKFLAIVVKVPPPVVASASYKASKKRLTVIGVNFESGAQFELNGLIVFPRKVPVFNAATNTYTVQGKRKDLHLNKGRGTNQVVVIVDGQRSQAFVF